MEFSEAMVKVSTLIIKDKKLKLLARGQTKFSKYKGLTDLFSYKIMVTFLSQ
jgi:hypothetical protein